MAASCRTWLAPQMMTVLCMATCVRLVMTASSQADLQWSPTPTTAAAPAAGDRQTMPPTAAVQNSHTTACFCSTHSTNNKQKLRSSAYGMHSSPAVSCQEAVQQASQGVRKTLQEDTLMHAGHLCCCYNARQGLAMQAHCTMQWRLGTRSGSSAAAAFVAHSNSDAHMRQAIGTQCPPAREFAL